MTFVNAWLLIAVVFATLWAFWLLMDTTADALSQWWDARDEQVAEDSSATKERDQSASQWQQPS